MLLASIRPEVSASRKTEPPPLDVVKVDPDPVIVPALLTSR